MTSFALLASDSDLPYRIVSIICQTLFYGIYLCLVPISVHIMVINGLQSRSRKWLLAMIMIMFALSTVYWILSVVVTFLVLDHTRSTGTHGSPIWLPMFSTILLVNYIVADGVVVWRAWVLCSDQRKGVLMIPVGMFVVNAIIYLFMVVVRAALLKADERDQGNSSLLAPMIWVSVVVHLMLSLLTNIFATSIIASKAWQYRRFLVKSGTGTQTPTRAVRILAILVESGVFYILIGVMALFSAALAGGQPSRMLGDVLMPVGVQLAGMYPILVLILVEQNRSLTSTYCSFGTIIDVRGVQPSQLESMSFAPGPIIASGDHNQTDSVTVLVA